MTALPSRTLGLHLRPEEFVFGAKYRLGMLVFPTTGTCPARGCRQDSDLMGDHALSCAIGVERIARHNGLRDCVFQAAQQAGLGPQKEVDNLLPPSVDRPADMFIRNYTNGKSTCLDLTATNALQAATVDGCAEDRAHPVQVAVDRKVRFYSARCEAENLAYVPVAIDTFGGWHSLALEAINRLSQELARATDSELGVVRRHFQ